MAPYVSFARGDAFANFSHHGGWGLFTYKVLRWLGVTEGFGYYHFNRDVSPLSGSSTPVAGSFMSYLFGPRLNLRKYDHFVPFGEFLVGGTKAGFELNGLSNQNAFAMVVGGGVDVVLTKNLAWRFAQLDYFMT